MAGALNAALRDALSANPDVVVFGEDVGPLGGVFRITDKLHAEFGEDRVWDSPLAEAGIVGTAIGMAMYGMRPVVEMQFDAFSFPAFEQIVSHVAKMRNRTRGRVALPIVIRIPCAGGIGGVEHHSRLVRGVLDAHPRAHRGHPVEPGGCVLDAARGDRQRRSGDLHGAEEPVLVEAERHPAGDLRADDPRPRGARGRRRHPDRLRAHRRRRRWRRPNWPKPRGSRSRSSTCAACRRSTTRRWARRCGRPPGRP